MPQHKGRAGLDDESIRKKPLGSNLTSSCLALKSESMELMNKTFSLTFFSLVSPKSK